jgi:hypothetical protein
MPDPAAAATVGRASVRYPGGLSARFRWAGSGAAAAVFGVSEALGVLHDHGPLVAFAPDRLCRAEIHVEGPIGAWTVRLASLIFDEPRAELWDGPGLLLVKYGFRVYALGARSGELAWSHPSGTPIVAVICSTRLDHALVQTEIETLSLRPDGEVSWRAAHNEVVTDAELVGGQLVLTSYGGQRLLLDPRTGQSLD